jgi:hypothetical protein
MTNSVERLNHLDLWSTPAHHSPQVKTSDIDHLMSWLTQLQLHRLTFPLSVFEHVIISSSAVYETL